MCVCVCVCVCVSFFVRYGRSGLVVSTSDCGVRRPLQVRITPRALVLSRQLLRYRQPWARAVHPYYSATELSQ